MSHRREAASVIGAALIMFGARGLQPSLGQDADRAPQAIGVPVSVEIDADESAIAAHQRVELAVTVVAEAELQGIRLRSSASGNVEIIAPIDTMLPRLAKDEQVRFSLPVRYTEPGESSVHVDVEAVIAAVGFRFGDRTTLNAIVRDDRAFAGTDDLVNLKRRALEYDRRVGRLSDREAARREKELSTVETVAGGAGPAPVARRGLPAATLWWATLTVVAAVGLGLAIVASHRARRARQESRSS